MSSNMADDIKPCTKSLFFAFSSSSVSDKGDSIFPSLHTGEKQNVSLDKVRQGEARCAES